MEVALKSHINFKKFNYFGFIFTEVFFKGLYLFEANFNLADSIISERNSY